MKIGHSVNLVLSTKIISNICVIYCGVCFPDVSICISKHEFPEKLQIKSGPYLAIMTSDLMKYLDLDKEYQYLYLAVECVL
jgi:hypothetical protein